MAKYFKNLLFTNKIKSGSLGGTNSPIFLFFSRYLVQFGPKNIEILSSLKGIYAVCLIRILACDA